MSRPHPSRPVDRESLYGRKRYRAFYAILRRTKTGILIVSSTSAKTTVAARPPVTSATGSDVIAIPPTARITAITTSVTDNHTRYRQVADSPCIGRRRGIDVVRRHDIARKSPAIMRITISNEVRIACPVISRPNTSRSAVTIFLMIEFSV